MHRWKTKIHFKHRVFNAMIFAMLFSMVPMGFQYLYLSILPASHWFAYEKIEPLHHEYQVDDFPRFVSYGNIYKPAQYRWTDVMRCDNGTGEYFYRSYESTAYLDTPRQFPTYKTDIRSGEETRTSWEYGFRVPDDVGAACYVDSSITVEMEFGITKTQNLQSRAFTIVE